MEESQAVGDAIAKFYQRFSAADTDGFAEGLSEAPGVSVIGSGPDEGHEGRSEWISVYDTGIKDSGMKLRGESPRGYEEGSVGWGVDRPSFVLPDGSALPMRLTAVLHHEDDEWKIVHLHFSVGVPDEQAMELAQG
jgi:ketosteroid isomerase-like protein